MINMKLISLIFLISFNLTIYKSFNLKLKERSWDKKTKEFFNSYFKTLLGDNFQLEDNCLSGEFDIDLDLLDNAIINMDIFLTLNLAKKVISLELSNCPYEVTFTILKDFKTALINGSFAINSIRSSNYIYHVIKDYIFESEKVPSQLGVVVGKLAKITIYGASS